MLRMMQYLKNRPALLKRFFFVCLGCIAGSDFFADRQTTHFFGDSIPLFWSVFGLAGCAVMAMACKWIAAKLLARDETYYDH